MQESQSFLGICDFTLPSQGVEEPQEVFVLTFSGNFEVSYDN